MYYDDFMIRITLKLLVLLFILSSCASLPENSDRTESHAFTDTQDTVLGRDVQYYMGKRKTVDGFILLGSGLDAFVARAVLAETAERSLDVQYYLYHNDLVGKLFTGFLWKAAERGVRVRLLIDDMGLAGRDEGIVALDSHPNIELRIFNPFDRNIARGAQFVTGLGSVTRRMHNKSFTADNVMTIVGGRNIGNEYYDADPTLEFADLDVLAIGGVVEQIRKLDTPVGTAVVGMMEFFNRFDSEKYGSDGAPLHDPCTIAYLLNPELFEGKLCNVEVETESALTRGHTAVDFWGVTDRVRNANWLYEVDADGFFTLLFERLKS